MMDKKYARDLSELSKRIEKISYLLIDDVMEIHEKRLKLSIELASISGIIDGISTILEDRYCK